MLNTTLLVPGVGISVAGLDLACEQQTYFRSSLLSPRKIRREKSDDRKYVCCSQASLDFRVYCCHSDIDFTRNCILTNFNS